MSCFCIGNFPIHSIRELDYILYDHLSKGAKSEIPDLHASFEKTSVRIACFKCCGIVRNPNRRPTQRSWMKKMMVIQLPTNDKIRKKVKDATYFEYELENKKKMKGYYEFAQLSQRKKFSIINIILTELVKEIPDSFKKCSEGTCERVQITHLSKECTSY